VIVSVGAFPEYWIAGRLIVPGETLIVLAGFYAWQGVLSGGILADGRPAVVGGLFS
jgi:membrane protein DedA with SNARE-associated domain